MKYLMIFFLFVLFPYTIHAQQKKAPEADALFQKILKEYTLNEDGSREYRCVKQVQLLTHHAFHRLYGETFIIYNPDYQELKINECYTTMADGKKIVTPANAFNKVLPRFAANAPVYNSLIEMVVTHTALEIGATIYLDYTLKSKKGFYPAFMGIEEIVELNPVESYDVKIKVPDGTRLNYKILNTTAEPLITLEGSKRAYTWQFHPSKPLIPENNQPDNSRFVPCLLFSAAKDMNEVMKTFISQPAFSAEFTNEMKTMAEQLVQDKDEPLTGVLAIQEKIINEFNLYSVPLHYTGYKVRTPAEAWKSAGGTEIEKVLLFNAILKSAGIQARLAGFFPGYYDKGLGNLSGLTHFYSLITLRDNTQFLLSLNEQNDQNLLLMKTGSYVIIQQGDLSDPVPPTLYQNSVRVSGELELDKDNSLTAKLLLKKQGLANPYLLLSRNSGRITSGISGLNPSVFTEKKINTLTQELLEAKLKAEASNACRQQGNYYFYSWPCSEGGVLSWHLGEFVTERDNPIEIPFPITESYSFEMELPSQWVLVNPLEKFEITNVAGRLSSECRQVKDKVVWACELSLYESPNLQPTNSYYLGLKELITRYSGLRSQGSIFKKP
ncbi:MAG: DUF3857 domain-containing protein [Bacteroidales bacterium]